MTIQTFQIICCIVLFVAYAYFLWPRSSRSRRMSDIFLLIITSWLGEQTCISYYDYYHYSSEWWFNVGHVPILIPLIWPMVVLSSIEVIQDLFPQISRAKKIFLLGLFVALDASLIEVVSVQAQLWSWSEAGYLQVPYIGILGWGFFAICAGATLTIQDIALRITASLLVVPLTHLLIQATWWMGLRWIFRGETSNWGVAPYVALSLALLWVIENTLLRSESKLRTTTTIPRVFASIAFLMLLLGLRREKHFSLLLLQLALVGAPYLWAIARKTPARL